jgi:hypothetical protein
MCKGQVIYKYLFERLNIMKKKMLFICGLLTTNVSGLSVNAITVEQPTEIQAISTILKIRPNNYPDMSDEEKLAVLEANYRLAAEKYEYAKNTGAIFEIAPRDAVFIDSAGTRRQQTVNAAALYSALMMNAEIACELRTGQAWEHTYSLNGVTETWITDQVEPLWLDSGLRNFLEKRPNFKRLQN